VRRQLDELLASKITFEQLMETPERIEALTTIREREVADDPAARVRQVPKAATVTFSAG
jgi:hypothetical protein